MNTINTLMLMPSNSSEVSTFFDGIKSAIINGEIDPLDVLRQITSMSNLIKEFNADKDIQDEILRESEKYGKKSFEAKNMKLQIKEVGVKYDFKNCGHSGWYEKQEKLTEVKNDIKNIETTLKTIKESSPELVDAESGEMLRPAAKTSTTKVVVSLV